MNSIVYYLNKYMDKYFKPTIGLFVVMFILVCLNNYSGMNFYRRILKCIPIAAYTSIFITVLGFVIYEIVLQKMKDKRIGEPCLTQFKELGFQQIASCCYHGLYEDYPIRVSWSEYNHFAKLKSAIRIDAYCADLHKFDNKTKKKAEKENKILILDEFISVFVNVNGKVFPEPKKVIERLESLINFAKGNDLKPVVT